MIYEEQEFHGRPGERGGQTRTLVPARTSPVACHFGLSARSFAFARDRWLRSIQSSVASELGIGLAMDSLRTVISETFVVSDFEIEFRSVSIMYIEYKVCISWLCNSYVKDANDVHDTIINVGWPFQEILNMHIYKLYTYNREEKSIYLYLFIYLSIYIT